MADLSLPTMPAGVSPQRDPQAEVRRWTRIGHLVIAATLGLGVLWSSLAPLSSAVLASGLVKVDSSRKKVQPADAGVVKDILVREGDAVRAGQVLVRLDATQAGAAHGVVTSGRDVALATQARLEAERDERGSLTFPADLQARAQAEPAVRQILDGQRTMFAVRRSAREGELGILEQQTGALRNEIEGFRSQRQAKDEQIASLQGDLEALVQLDREGMVERTRLRSVEREIARLKGERDELTAKAAAAQTAIGELQLKKSQVRRAFLEGVADDLKKVQGEQLELHERQVATRRNLELTALRAPVDGVVTELRVHTPGGVVGPGEVLMEVVPSADRLVIEGRVLPGDIDRLHPGQPAGVKVHAFNRRTTPELTGEVAYVSPDAAIDPRTEGAYFVVKVTVPAAELQRLGDQKVQPGMLADLYIRTGERTFLGYLLEPLTDSFSKAWLER